MLVRMAGNVSVRSGAVGADAAATLAGVLLALETVRVVVPIHDLLRETLVDLLHGLAKMFFAADGNGAQVLGDDLLDGEGRGAALKIVHEPRLI
ncbi:hypothetical protein EBZ80_24330 [bacterium]|nr:hypothetical protein [bacterium]